MALIFESVLERGFGSPPEGAADVYLLVPSKYFSIPYKLPSGALIIGRILDITTFFGVLGVEEIEILSEMRQEDIEFILRAPYIGLNDYLYIS